MRCLAGFVIFVVLYFGSCHLLGVIVAKNAIDNPELAAFNAVNKYHAILEGGSGLIAICACCLPTLLAKLCAGNEEWRKYEAELEREKFAATARRRRG